jgi:hypothetical protein
MESMNHGYAALALSNSHVATTRPRGSMTRNLGIRCDYPFPTEFNRTTNIFGFLVGSYGARNRLTKNPLRLLSMLG